MTDVRVTGVRGEGCDDRMDASLTGSGDGGTVILSYQLDDADWRTLLRHPALVKARRHTLLVIAALTSIIVGFCYLLGFLHGPVAPLMLAAFLVLLAVKTRARKPPAWSARISAVATRERIEIISPSATINWAWSEIESLDEIGTRCVIVHRKPKAAAIIGLDRVEPADLARLRLWAAQDATLVPRSPLPWAPAVGSPYALVQGTPRPWASIGALDKRTLGALVAIIAMYGLLAILEPHSPTVRAMAVTLVILLGVMLILIAATLIVRLRKTPQQSAWLCEPMQVSVTSAYGPQRLPWQTVKTLRLDRWHVALLIGRGRLLATMPRNAFAPGQLQWVIDCAQGAGVKITGPRPLPVTRQRSA